ncbi:Abi family protein [Desulfopila aestuarii]|nr:Abi family protein [Desulfopila aestuarii]
MAIDDDARAIRKLSQIGYYRLSGFWYPCRKPKTDNDGNYLKDEKTKLPLRHDNFQENVNISDIIDLYLFDKKLRQLMLDAVERIEIFMRSIIAHEIGKIDPLAYEKEDFINPKIIKTKRKKGNVVNYWFDWLHRLNHLVDISKEDSIISHKANNKPIPFWAVVECWDYGLMSKYFENMNGRCQNLVAKRLDLDNATMLTNWLVEIGLLRNKCAHHSRIWNRDFSNPISLKGVQNDPYFQKLNLDEHARKKLYGRIAVIWYLIKKIGPGSTWLLRVADLVDSKPPVDSCPFTAMGFKDNSGFPRELFSI